MEFIKASILRSSATCAETKDVLLHLLVDFGVEILKIIPGRVSTEVDASLSHDTEGTIKEALKIIAFYQDRGIPKERVLIKIASTWEGIQAAKELEAKFSIHCNMTLIFNTTQAIACAEAGATLVSPFVGRISDWHKRKFGAGFDSAGDPGVKSVLSIFGEFAKRDFGTKVMAASFRSTHQILALAGVDLITISPSLLEELGGTTVPVSKKVLADGAKKSGCPKAVSKAQFHEDISNDLCASELLQGGISKFDSDTKALEQKIGQILKENRVEGH